MIVSGTVLKVPVDASEPDRDGSAEEIVVEPGDTLSAIARRNRMNVRTLASLNHMGVNDTLRAGQRLVVSRSGSGAAPRATTASRGSGSGGGGSSYTVRRGDTLWDIAKRFGVSVSQIVALNGLSGNSIKPGQKLTVKKIPG